ncbi:MAG: hypothetical protein AVDCRST_MAG33-2425 [uncultured Thermomicrobiales bacterium]|uniref:Uncharacterized protein n=1 Tax=uncultured Thermomicrobiales bacterium TaxID=1645740 RepID=A0A6J4V6G3_9BACT|nr:MAG: hypothetical protein AVDCRST_MAG33-2425 [uncultured Thermomicrobiales bacterium]
MSDEPRNRQSDDRRFPAGESVGTSGDDRPGTTGSPLRTRRDPIARDGAQLRPASPQPPWQEEPAQRRRGTGRYASPTGDLPPAAMPDGVPAWMGQNRAKRDGSARREPVVPRPLGGAVRHADDYVGGRPGHAGASSMRPGATGSWPVPPKRSEGPSVGQRVIDPPGRDTLLAPPQDAVTGAAGEGTVAGPAPRRRASGERRFNRRSSIGALDDPITTRLLLLVAVSAAAMWAVTRLLAGNVEEALVLRLGVDGAPSQIAGAGAIWRVPFVATMLALMSIGTALLVAARDRFAARFLLGAGVLVQALIWVAAITLLR